MNEQQKAGQTRVIKGAEVRFSDQCPKWVQEHIVSALLCIGGDPVRVGEAIRNLPVFPWDGPRWEPVPRLYAQNRLAVHTNTLGDDSDGNDVYWPFMSIMPTTFRSSTHEHQFRRQHLRPRTQALDVRARRR